MAPRGPHIDNVDGIGSTPNNANVDYLGLRVRMKPSTFLRLARPLDTPRERTTAFMPDHMRSGGGIGAPTFYIGIPGSWFEGDLDRPATINNHEGRHRMRAIQEVFGDDPVEVHLFFDGGLRARHIKPSFVKRMKQGLTPERGGQAAPAPLFEVFAAAPGSAMEENGRREQPALFDPADDGDTEPDDEVLTLLREEGPPDTDEGQVYNGRRVRWLGEEGRMYRARWDQVHPRGGNIFYPGKLPAFVEYARELLQDGDKPLWRAPPGWAHGPVTIQDIEESQQALQHGVEDLYSSYGMTRAFSTGDEDLDEYIRDRQELRRELAKLEAEETEEDCRRDELRELIAEMEPRVEEAVASESGDLGTILIDLRDGNHRAFSAKLMGEPYVWVYITRGEEGPLTADDLE